MYLTSSQVFFQNRMHISYISHQNLTISLVKTATREYNFQNKLTLSSLSSSDPIEAGPKEWCICS